MATIIEVAHEAGVSQGAASDILRGRFRYNYRPDTVERVRSAAEKLGYQANGAARLLREKNRTLIGTAVPLQGAGSQSLIRMVAVTHRFLTEAGFEPLQVNSERLIATESHVPFPNLNLMAGVLSADARMEETVPDFYKVLQRQLPVVALYPTRSPDVSYVSVNRARILELAAQHLAELGHRRVAVAGHWKSPYLTDQNKVQAWPRLRKKFGFDSNPRFLFDADAGTVDLCYAAGQHIVESLFAMTPRPTALICLHGTVAMSVLSHLAATGRRAPEQLSVIGYDYDAAHFGGLSFPRLTALSRPDERIAELASGHLVRLIRDAPEDNLLAPLRQEIDPVLTVRESTGPAPATV